MKKRVLRNFTKFRRKHLCQSLFFNKLAGLRHRCFPVHFAKFLRTPFLRNTSVRLLPESNFPHVVDLSFEKPLAKYCHISLHYHETVANK